MCARYNSGLRIAPSPLSHRSLPSLTSLPPLSHIAPSPLSHRSLPSLTSLPPLSHIAPSPLSHRSLPSLTSLPPLSHIAPSPLSHRSLPSLTSLPSLSHICNVGGPAAGEDDWSSSSVESSRHGGVHRGHEGGVNVTTVKLQHIYTPAGKGLGEVQATPTSDINTSSI